MREGLSTSKADIGHKHTWELLQHAATMAIDALRSSKAFSLIGFSKRQDGEVVAHLIVAETDAQMIQKAKAALHLKPTTCFALIGEGVFGTPQGKMPAFLAYLQNAELAAPLQLYRCYTREGSAIELKDEWRVFSQLTESWL